MAVVFIYVGTVSGSLCHKLVAHLTQPFDFGFHHIAGFEESNGALADAAAGPATENVAGLEREDMRGIFDLLLGRLDELRCIAVLLEVAVHGQPDEQVHVVLDEGARHQKRPHGGEIVVALAVEPI